MIKGVSHIGIAVRDLQHAMEFYGSILGLELSPVIETVDTRVCIVRAGDCQIELMQPTTGRGPIGKFVEKRGEGIQHVSFEVDNIRTALQILSERGMDLIDREPQEGIEGQIAFLHPRKTHGVLIELVQKPH